MWRYSEAGENVSVSVIFYSSFPPWPQKLWAQKRFANPWNVTNPAVNMTDQATLIVKDAATRKFEGQITLELETSLGIQRRSTVSLSVIGLLIRPVFTDYF